MFHIGTTLPRVLAMAVITAMTATHLLMNAGHYSEVHRIALGAAYLVALIALWVIAHNASRKSLAIGLFMFSWAFFAKVVLGLHFPDEFARLDMWEFSAVGTELRAQGPMLYYALHDASALLLMLLARVRRGHNTG